MQASLPTAEFDEINGSGSVIDRAITGSDGVASVEWQYTPNGVYAFGVRVSVQIITNPVMLTVGKATTLSLNVSEPVDFKYTVSGKLLYNGQPVANKQIIIKVNGTAVAAVNTTSDGTYTLTLKLKPVDNKATNYQVEAIFYGDIGANATLMGLTPNGTEYAICTTLQYYGYKPSSNSATLTVEPQSTLVLIANKTPEQLQAEAEQNGWLKPPRPWFSWWYP